MRYANITLDEVREYREELDTVLIRDKKPANNNQCSYEALHIPKDGEPMCNVGTNRKEIGWKEKDMACYPEGHKQICRKCIQKDKGGGQKYTEAEMKDAVERANRKTKYQTLSRAEYNKQATQNDPCGYTIAKYFGNGKWTEARGAILND